MQGAARYNAQPTAVYASFFESLALVKFPIQVARIRLPGRRVHSCIEKSTIEFVRIQINNSTVKN